ncbi:hypothetical protein ACFY05_33030 [Microtetraspora fusca]|uniref:Uncharacterized protein n=1 Tax=Microtetraspora fusca TaxID=1997 RepID=A0ABW6VE67_MICFU
MTTPAHGAHFVLTGPLKVGEASSGKHSPVNVIWWATTSNTPVAELAKVDRSATTPEGIAEMLRDALRFMEERQKLLDAGIPREELSTLRLVVEETAVLGADPSVQGLLGEVTRTGRRSKVMSYIRGRRDNQTPPTLDLDPHRTETAQ